MAAGKTGLLVACYGSTRGSLAPSVAALAEAVHREVCRRWGAPCGAVPCAVARAGAASELSAAFGRLREKGASEVVVAATQLVPGHAYRQVEAAAADAAERFAAVRLGAPLIGAVADASYLAEALARRHPPVPGQAVVFVGHGAEGPAQLPYAALAQFLRMTGRADLLVGTLRLRPCFEDVLRELRGLGARRALLVPLMLAAGVHAARDIAGSGPESWRARLAAAGYEVEVHPEGLADMPAVRELVARHALAAEPVACGPGPVRCDADGSRGGGGASAGLAVAPTAAAERSGNASLAAVASGCAALAEVGAALRAEQPPAASSLSAAGALGVPGAAPRPSRFPLFVSLAGARCLVVGAGTVGTRRAQALARFGARVTWADPRLGAAGAGEGWGQQGPAGAVAVDLLPRAYQPGDEEGCALVVAATGDRAVNRQVGARCRAAGIPVSVADAADECTFFFPALAEGPALVCGIVSTDGDHVGVARAASAVRRVLAGEESA